MPVSIDPALRQVLHGLAPGIAVGHRVILPGDDTGLLDEEARSIVSTVPAMRRASGAARRVARELLARLGHPGCPLPKSPSGAPAWPPGIVGSLAHDDRIAVAAVALRREIALLGIDVEPAQPLPPDVLDLVATAQEQRSLALDAADRGLRARHMFAAKEAVYKALHPADRVFLEYADIAVDLDGGRAVVSNGRVLALRFGVASHIVALAFRRAAADDCTG